MMSTDYRALLRHVIGYFVTVSSLTTVIEKVSTL